MSTSEPGIAWRTSSYSASNGECVEVGWKVSSFSAGNGACVEVNDIEPIIRVRDTKDRQGGQLAFEQASWQAFLGRLEA